MKRFTLFFVTALFMAVTSLAQTGQQRVIKQPDFGPQKSAVAKKAPKKSSLQRQHDASLQTASRWAFADAMKGKAKLQQARQQKAIGDMMIYNQPKGDYVSYVRSSNAYTYFWGIYQTYVSGGAGDVVFGSNGNVYIKNLISQYACDTWSVGKLEGDKITFEFPQPCLDANGTIYYIILLNYDANSDAYVAQQKGTLTLYYDAETGAIETPDGSEFSLGSAILGLCSDTGDWTGYGDWNISMTKQTDEPLKAPEGLETAQYSLTADGYNGSLLNVGFQGDDIYVQGICSTIPNAWVKGTISGNKAIFKSGQYLGSDNSYHQYLMAGDTEELYDDYYSETYTQYVFRDGDIEFDYDAATKTLTNSNCFMINGGTAEVNYLSVLDKATIKPFKEVAATPAAPSINSYDYYGYADHANYGWWALEFKVPTLDVDGNFILPEKLSYQVWTRVGDEEKPFVLSAKSYVNLTEDMAEIPYGFSDGWDITEIFIYLYAVGFDAVGIRSIYRGAGETRESEITWLELGSQPEKETPAYPEVDPSNTGSTVTYSVWDGKSDFSMIGEGMPMTYDVATKLQNEDITGTHIDKITFALMNTKGISNVKVWLSSNLRVEGGKNAANLVEIPVTVTEPGFITVALEKPYTIPTEGVYVGYTFTVDDISIEANLEPIVIVPGNTKGGLFIHASEIYVGWTDLTNEAGASAFIMADISGSSIKDNAATVAEADNLYIKTGEPVNVETTIVNHGSNGITSVDIEYALNGTTATKHFDLAEPIGGFFGQSATVKAELPAIAERGNYDLTTKVTKVNGKDNQDAATQGVTKIIALNSVPKHRTLLEEYTGTWCGWCVRGYVGLEKLAELYPDEYVLIAYHNDDPMEIMSSSYFPSPVSGFPASWIDRIEKVDPYYGYDQDYGIAPLTVIKPLNERAKVFGQAVIELKANLNDDNSSVDAVANITFPYDTDENNYAIEYVLVANGLTGEGSDWEQSNYYSGENTGDANLAPFEQAESHVAGLKFNDVAVMMSEIGGIENSLPAAIKADETVSSNYTFYLDFALNTSFMPVIQDVNNLYVVALLVNQKTGEVANAIKTKVEAYDPTGIETVMKSGLSTVTERYNAAGQRITAPQKGLNIIKLSNGKTVKVMVK